MALLLKRDLSDENSKTMAAFIGMMIAANAFMIGAVVVQSVLQVTNWRIAAQAVEEAAPIKQVKLANRGSQDIR